VAASFDLLDEQERAEPWLVDASSCLPVEGADRRQVRSNAWGRLKLQLLAIVIFFASLGLAAWGASLEDNAGKPTPAGMVLMWVGGIAAILDGILMLWTAFAADSLQKRILRRRLIRRPGSFLEVTGGLKTRLLRLENANTYHVAKTTPEDLCVCAFDPTHKRLLMEGITHRYVIRGDDVTSLWPLQSGPTISLQLAYRIGEEPLTVVLAADNPLFHVLHGAFAHRTLKTFVRQLVGTFGREFPDAGTPLAKAESPAAEL
jgi:hypothetical protein